MQSHDLRCESSVENPDLVTMSDEASTPTHHPNEPQDQQEDPESSNRGIGNEINHNTSNSGDSLAKKRPSRACTQRGAARLQAAVAEEAAAAAAERRSRAAKKERFRERSPEPSPPPEPQCKIITPLTVEPPESLLPRWGIRSMWEFASILNFLNVFRPLLNITVEFSAEELETALLTPNNTLADVHMPLLKAIPPITRMALGHNTWITVLCRKLRDWWHWVAEGELPLVASHGAEVETYNALDPGVRVVILKALCDIRVEQEDIRSNIDNSIKHGIELSAFRKERIGGDSYGISYWYEEDPIIGHRLYREIRQVEVKKVKGKNVQPIPSSSYQWETVATNLDEFQDVSDKLSSSENRTEASVGKKLKVDMLPEIEKVQKRKEKLLKKQQREALLLDNMMNVDGLIAGRSRRDRKRVTYTFDDYERSITEAIKTEQTKPSSELNFRREIPVKPDASMNVRWLRVIGPSQPHQQNSSDAPSLKSFDCNGTVMDQKPEILDRSNRRRQRPRRYSTDEFVEAVSDIEVDIGSDDDVVGEVEYDEEYLRQRKQKKKMSNSSDGDEEYHWDEHNLKEIEPEDDESADSLSEGSGEPRRRKKLLNINRRTKLKSVQQLESSPRRSKRAIRNCISFRQYEMWEPEAELTTKLSKSNASGGDIYSKNREVSMGTQDLKHNKGDEVKEVDKPVNELVEIVGKEANGPLDNSNIPGQDVSGAAKETQSLDLSEASYSSQFTETVQHNNER